MVMVQKFYKATWEIPKEDVTIVVKELFEKVRCIRLLIIPLQLLFLSLQIPKWKRIVTLSHVVLLSIKSSKKSLLTDLGK